MILTDEELDRITGWYWCAVKVIGESNDPKDKELLDRIEAHLRGKGGARGTPV